MPDMKAKCKACGAEVILKVKIHEYTKEAKPIGYVPTGTMANTPIRSRLSDQKPECVAQLLGREQAPGWRRCGWSPCGGV